MSGPRPIGGPSRWEAELARACAWLATRGHEPAPFQLECWRAQAAGRSGLVHAPTGTGKTLAVWLGTLLEHAASQPLGWDRGRDAPGLALWITPMRALAADTADSLRQACAGMGLSWSVEMRTGDTSASLKARQRERLPACLVTTPESLCVLLSHAQSARALSAVRAVVVDEWHELLGTKRGVQTELALSRLRGIAPGLRVWGLSATIADIDGAARVLIRGSKAVIVRGKSPKRIEVRTVVPGSIERFPWAGHLGTRLVDDVIALIESAQTTLVFTNTRSQAELWFRQIMQRRPDLIGQVGLHHGSLDRRLRELVEGRLDAPAHEGGLRAVVCTSSLDLGVDFAPVDRVIQVGSPKGVARLIQRAGRSGHRPGEVSSIVGVPTHAMELVEFAAARRAIERGNLEGRHPLTKPLDVLAQHVVTVAAGGGIDEHQLLAEVRSTHAYEGLSDEEWRWTLDFVGRGGPSLTVYPQHARVVHDPADADRLVVRTASLARSHRMGIGTIAADAAVLVQYTSGRSLGTIEESFVSRLRAGDRFVLAGRMVELDSLHGMTARVRPARGVSGAVPRWGGGKMPLSSRLADAVLDLFARMRSGHFDEPELDAVRPLIERQRAISVIPGPGELLIERARTRAGAHTFLFPFAGRLAHEGLGAVLSLRLARAQPRSIQATVTDYGLELLTQEAIDLDEPGWRAMLSGDRLVEDLLEAVNATVFARRQFRDIARIAGLTSAGFPGQRVPARHLQASSEMFFDVFEQFDPGNLLLAQAKREVLEEQLELRRLRETIDRLARAALVLVDTPQLTPLAFPLYAESLRASTVSSETWEQRVRRMASSLDGSGAAWEEASSAGRPKRRPSPGTSRKDVGLGHEDKPSERRPSRRGPPEA